MEMISGGSRLEGSELIEYTEGDGEARLALNLGIQGAVIEFKVSQGLEGLPGVRVETWKVVRGQTSDSQALKVGESLGTRR